MTTHPSQEPEIPEDILQKLEEECEDDCEYADSELSAAWKMGYMVRAKAEYLRHLTAQTPVGGMRWVKCMDRMPVVPDPVPADTPDERPVIFWNERHSSLNSWFPSFGWSAEKIFPLEKDVDRNLYDEGFGREYWEWLDESAPPSLPVEPEEGRGYCEKCGQGWHDHSTLCRNDFINGTASLRSRLTDLERQNEELRKERDEYRADAEQKAKAISAN